MRGVDTNVLVRFLVGDDPAQAARAASLFARATAEGERLFVAQIVVCELAWVLGYASRRAALERFAAGDLADWLIWERSRAAGAERVVTFDGQLLRSPEFVEV